MIRSGRETLNTIDIEILCVKRLECLFVGVGVDDMFVIVQAWSNLASEICQTQPIQERIGLTLKHAVSCKRSKSFNNFLNSNVHFLMVYGIVARVE